MRFSANLGFLWQELALPDAIRAAKSAGFDAVECHWPYDADAQEVLAALVETGLPMLGLNTRRGDVSAGENGLCALPGREDEARDSLDEAVRYATIVGAGAVHVMAGRAQGAEARETLIRNLTYAVAQVDQTDISLLIEPLNPNDAPGYFYHTISDALDIIDTVQSPKVKLMFDCYHVGRTEGDVIRKLRAHQPSIGHIQFASVPDRGTPDQGELRYSAIFQAISEMGWEQPLGAEYKPSGPTSESLGWMQKYPAGSQ